MKSKIEFYFIFAFYRNWFYIQLEIADWAPLFACQEAEDHLRMPTDFLGLGEYFALHVSGDSMKNIAINTGAIAIVRAWLKTERLRL